MKPNNIVFMRHGQSQGNVDRTLYETVPDYALRLTAKGQLQAQLQAQHLVTNVFSWPYRVACYTSPFWRTRDTLAAARPFLKVDQNFDYEDPRLREQEWAGGLSKYSEDMEVERDGYGHFYWRFPNGESCADVFDRVSDFVGSLHRDFEKPNFPSNCLITTHGMTMRVLLMRWLHMSVEQFELLANPNNCGIYHLRLDKHTNKYALVEPARVHDKQKSKYSYVPIHYGNTTTYV